jgi:hypothetical protein
MRFTCWITKVTDTDSEYVLLAFLLQEWLCEGTSRLFCKYIACLVRYSKEKSRMGFILLANFSDFNDKLTNSVAGGNILSVSVW